MKRFSFRFLAIAVLAVGLAACRVAPVYNVHETALMSEDTSVEQVGKVIERAGASLGWLMREVEPGHMVGRLVLRTHVAEVDINYDEDSFTIAYKDSVNLKYDGTRIHQNYNGWIQNLEKAIIAQSAAI